MAKKSIGKTSIHLGKGIKNIIVYAIPFFILLIGCIVDFVIIPKYFSHKISLLAWLFSNTQNIANLLYYPGATALPGIHNIIGIRIFWWIWISSFLTSLFFVSRKFHQRTEVVDENAILINKDPYFKILDIRKKLIQVQDETAEMESIIVSLKYLEERLKNETNFGYGKEEVIVCENHIAEQLQHLSNIITTIKPRELHDSSQVLNDVIIDINFSLQKRIDLKRR